jgi:polyisoprenoid-binding protein YceI
MSNAAKVGIVGGLAAVIAIAVVAFMFLRPPAEASQPITAAPLATAALGAPEPSAAAITQATSAPAATADAGPAAAATAPSASGSASEILAQISQEESEARFIVDEVLNNAPQTVIGTTNQVAGELVVNPANPSQTRVGPITINARTLSTDSEFRNRALKNQILATNEYEFITFTPSQIIGLPGDAKPGQSYTFQIAGDLTIKGVTKPVTFDVTVNPVSDARLEGTANATIRYADFGITIPRVQQVASVAEQVRLELSFVAVPKA